MASELFFTIQNDISMQMFKPDYKLPIYKLIIYLYNRFEKGKSKFLLFKIINLN